MATPFTLVLVLRITHHKAVLRSMLRDPAVIRILLRIVVVRGAVPEVDLQVERESGLSLRIVAAEHFQTAVAGGGVEVWFFVLP